MKIEYPSHYTCHLGKMEVKDYVSSILMQQKEAWPIERTIGRLVSVLCEKGLLTASDVATVVGEHDENVSLVKKLNQQ